MAADDFLNQPDQGSPSDLDPTSPYGGNRPASGARRATPGEVLSQGFQGAQNAGDFLGLDVEFTGSQDPNQGYGAAPLDLVSPPSTYDASSADAQGVVAPAPMPASDPVQEFAEAPSAFEFGEDLGSEEGDFVEAAPDSTSKRPMLLAAFAMAVLAGAGLYFWPTLKAQFLGSKTEVARVDGPPSAPVQRGEPSAPAPKVEPAKGPESASAASQGAQTAPPTPVNRPVVPPPTVKQEPLVVVEDLPSQGTQAEIGDVLEGLIANSGGAGATPAQPTGFPDLSGTEYAWASEDQLELIWRGSEVPLDAVNAPAKTLMPRIGQVRVFMTTGDVFDGRLYAVGQKRVWIDAAPGRVGLDGERVERIEVLPPTPAGVLTGGGEPVAGGKRVRVRVPGGVLFGRVLKAEGEDVLLALDDGGRVRVKGTDVLDLGSGRTIVVGR